MVVVSARHISLLFVSSQYHISRRCSHAGELHLPLLRSGFSVIAIAILSPPLCASFLPALAPPLHLHYHLLFHPPSSSLLLLPPPLLLVLFNFRKCLPATCARVPA